MNILLIGYLFFAFFILAILADLLPFSLVINRILQLSAVSVQTIRSNTITDTKKEKLLLTNSWELFKQSLKMTGFILLIAAWGCLFLFTSGIFKTINYHVLFSYLKTTDGIILSVVAFLSYFILKKIYVRIRL